VLVAPAPTGEGTLHAPQVFVPVYVQTHARVRCSDEGVTVELWRRPKPAPMSLPWIERVAIVGRSPIAADTAAAPRVIDRQVIARRKTL